MVLVFIYHSEVIYYNQHSWSWVFSPFFLTGFFFVSGFLFTRDLSTVRLNQKWKQVFRGLLFPYIVFEALMVVPKLLVGRTEFSQFVLDFILFRESWFIVALGLMQLLYAAVLEKKPSMNTLVIWSSVFFILGIALCSIYKTTFPYYEIVKNNRILYSPELPNRLPFCVNIALLYSPFFALGIFCGQHRIRFANICKRGYLILSTVLYIVLYIIVDHSMIGSWWFGATGTFHNLPLMIIYALIGIWMQCCISCAINKIFLVNYIGKNSIVYMFLNGGALLIISLIVNKLHILDSSNYLHQILVAVISIIFVTIVTLFINRFFPLLRGDKNAFNRLSKRLGINIEW